jgi:TRAP-type mannitol/chloroaromatic compound transport system substrate-binding protein
LTNLDQYNALSDQYKHLLTTVGKAEIIYGYAETEGVNFKAMQEMQEKYGVNVRRWTDAQLAVFEKAWFEVLAERAASDADFKRVADHYLDFRAKYKVWGAAQALNATYQ